MKRKARPSISEKITPTDVSGIQITASGKRSYYGGGTET
jgi:hypothetical protein